MPKIEFLKFTYDSELSADFFYIKKEAGKEVFSLNNIKDKIK